MVQILARVEQIDNSLMIKIPYEIIEREHIKQGDLLQISIDKVKIDSFGCCKGIGSFTKEDELDTHE